MAKDNSKYLILGGVILAAVYLVTRRQTTVQAPAPQVAQQQLLNWAQVQPSQPAWTSIISNLSIDDVLNLWDRIFGSGKDEPKPDAVFDGYDDSWTDWI